MPNLCGHVNQSAHLSARTFGTAEHVVVRPIRAALKAFRNIAHDGNGGALKLVFECPVPGAGAFSQEGVGLNDDYFSGLPGFNFFESGECSH